MAVTRAVIQEVGSRADPFALGTLAQEVLDNYADSEFRNPVRSDYAYAVLFTVLENEFTGRDGGIPAHLEADQLEDWLCGRAIRAGLAAQRAQDDWDAAHKGATNG